MSNLFDVIRGTEIYKIGLATGVKIGGNAAKSVNNTHLLVAMRVRLLQNIGMINLMNQDQFKKGNGYKLLMKSVRYYWGMRLMLHTRSIYYRHTFVDLLGARRNQKP